MEVRKIYVSHIGISDLPIEHPQKRLVFYTTTQKDEEQGIFFVRFSTTEFKQGFIEKLIQDGKCVKLNKTIPITKGKMIWLTQEGNVCLGENSDNNQNFEFLFKYQELIQARV